jgi:hypothetical protein
MLRRAGAPIDAGAALQGGEMTRARARAWLVAVMVPLCGGCLLAGNYHSARTLGKGESHFGLNFATITYESRDQSGDVDSITLPSLIPELTYHVGLSDDLEVGGRVGLAQLALEGDIKYRLLQSDQLHIAIAPAISVQSLIITTGTSAVLPGIATIELSDNVAITGSLFGRVTRYSSVDIDDSDEDLSVFSGSLFGTGASFGVEFRGEQFLFRPGFEYTRYALDFGDEDDFSGFNTFSLVVHVGFIGGREKKQLDRIEEKLDRLAPPPRQ